MEPIANNNLVSNLPEERGWEYKQITVTRVPGYGFGIAVSGGRDNPHFASGDPSIAVSDVLASGPAERMLQVNDRIISVNGISLQNVDYATAVQVLRDSGDTVVLVVKRRTTQHQHSHSLTTSYTGPPLAALGINPLSPKVTLTKNSKKEDFGIVLGCKLFIKEISAKARDQLINTNQTLNEGDFITKINNSNCNDVMSIKEAKKIIDGTKDKLHICVSRDFNVQPSNISHQAQSSVSTTGAVNNFHKGDDFLTSGQSYSNQNLYVQPPTRNPNLNTNGFDDKLELTSGPNSLLDDKSNLAPRGRLRGPINETNLSQLDNRNSMAIYGRSKGIEEPPRPPPPRAEDYYSSRRQLYDDDPIIQKTKQPIPDARFITFHKEGSVGIRLTGGNFVGIFVTAVQPGSPASLQGLQPGDKILKVNDMDMKGVTREEAVLFLLSLQDRIELIVQFCKEEYDSIVASQKGDSFYIKTHFHYESPAKGEMSFRSGDIFHVVDTLYNGVVGCWQVYRIGRNNQEVQKGIIPNKARAEELATAQFNATKKEMSANESRGSFFRRRRSSNRRSKSLGKEHWDDILFSDTVSKFPAYERVILKHPGFTRPVILFGPIADMAREKLIKDFPDKFISPQLDNNVDDTKSTKVSSNIIKLSAIREVISTGKHALLDITPNAVERLNYAQLYPIVVFFKAETKIVIKQLRQGLLKSAHKSSKKLLEQCHKLDKVWSHIFSSSITLNDNTENWYRKVREIIDKQQSGALWMSESKLGVDIFSDIYFPVTTHKPKACRSLPSQYRSNKIRTHRAPVSMYESPQIIPRVYYHPIESYYSPSQSSLYSSSYQQSLNTSIYQNQYASSFPLNYGCENNKCSFKKKDLLADNKRNFENEPLKNLQFKDIKECINNINNSMNLSDVLQCHDNEPIYYDCEQGNNATLKKFTAAYDPQNLNSIPSPINFNPEECLSDDFLFPMSSLRLSYASSPESDLEHSPGPPLSPGLSAIGSTNGGRLTKASSDPSVVMADNSTTDVLPPYQPTYDSRYGFNTQNISDPQTPTTPTNKDMGFMTNTSQDHTNNNDQNAYTKSQGIYNHNSNPSFDKNEYTKQDIRNEFANDQNKNISHKRQNSSIHGHFNHAKGPSISEHSPSRRSPKDVYGTAPDLPPRVDRAIKPSALPSTPVKTSNGRSAHERLFGTKPMQSNEGEQMNMENPNFNNKISSLDRSQNSKSDSLSSYDSFNNPNTKHNTRIIPNAHDDLKTTLSKIDPAGSNIQNSPSKYGSRWDQGNHRHERLGSKLDLKYSGIPPNSNSEMIVEPSAANSMQLDKELGSMEQILQRNPDRERIDSMYRYSRSPGKQGVPSKQHIETKTDYGKYSRNNTAQEYTRSSHQDLTQSHLSILQPHGHHHSPMKSPPPTMNHHQNNSVFENGQITNNPNTYKPIPPPKPKNYKPPYKAQGNFNPNDGIMQPPLHYQHGKSHSNPVDQRSPANNTNNHNYYYNMPQNQNTGWHTETAVRYNTNIHGHYDMTPPYESRRHTNISYASRSEIAPISQQDLTYGVEGGDILDTRAPDRHNIVDLQGSREQRGSAFELYRKPVHHNLRGEDYNALYGSQPNLANNQSSATTNTKQSHKIAKTQSFKYQKTEGLSTPKFLRKFLSKYRDSPKPNKNSLKEECIPENEVKKDFNRNCEYMQANERDVTSATVDYRGTTLVNKYWGVSLEIPPNAIPEGTKQEVYFVITDPRFCENAPPLDLENGETMLSPLVMCGPQGTEFLKPVVLHIPHYANTLPSLGISLKATDSESDICTDWDNILLPSNHAANSVAVKVDHF